MHTKKVAESIEKAYNYCNTNSLDDDCIFKAIYKYKALRELKENEQNEVYDILAKRLGFK